MLRIRFQRVGRKKHPVFRIIVSERTKDTQAGSLELLGTIDPVSKTKIIKADRIKEWMSKGAQPTASVHNMLVSEGIIEGNKQSVVTITKKRQGKLEEKRAAEEEKKKAAAEAKAAKEAEEKAAKEAEAKAAKEAEEAAKAAEETPAQEAPSEEKKEDAAE